MSLPEPQPHDDDAFAPEPDAPARKGEPPAAKRPDWLVGAEEGVAAEFDRSRAKSGEAVHLKLVKPVDRGTDPPREGEHAQVPELTLGSDSFEMPASRATGAPRPDSDASEAHPPIQLSRPDEMVRTALPQKPAAKPEPEKAKVAWTAAASSIPLIRRNPLQYPPPSATYTEPQPDETAGMPELPDDSPLPVPAAKLPPLKESWLMVAADALRHDLKVQILTGLTVLLAGVIMWWPHSQPTVSLSQIRHHADQFDGRSVTVHGRVGEVFPMGGGYTFYLLQGRDTMVVFTRTRTPVSREMVTVHGNISTGYLDGMPRQSIFEDTK